jgi:hypothetical protein
VAVETTGLLPRSSSEGSRGARAGFAVLHEDGRVVAADSSFQFFDLAEEDTSPPDLLVRVLKRGYWFAKWRCRRLRSQRR